MPVTIGLRLERVLIKMAEDETLPKGQRLKAAIELARLKELNRTRRVPQTASNTVLGSKASER